MTLWWRRLCNFVVTVSGHSFIMAPFKQEFPGTELRMAKKWTFTALIKNCISCRVRLLNGMCQVQYKVNFMDNICGTMSITTENHLRIDWDCAVITLETDNQRFSHLRKVVPLQKHYLDHLKYLNYFIYLFLLNNSCKY